MEEKIESRTGLDTDVVINSKKIVSLKKIYDIFYECIKPISKVDFVNEQTKPCPYCETKKMFFVTLDVAAEAIAEKLAIPYNYYFDDEYEMFFWCVKDDL